MRVFEEDNDPMNVIGHDDEHVDIESIYKLYDLLDEFVRRCESPGRYLNSEKENNKVDFVECKRHSSGNSKGFF